MAELHPQLQKDCLLVGRFTLCRLLLMRDANYPWFILVPDRDGITEIFQLSEEDQVRLLRESSRLSAVLVERFRADKLNIAALGNVVPQLHVHHVVRYRDDPAWPAPVWGRVPARPYSPEGLSAVLETLRSGLPNNFEYF
jgi:diadenosine tetraphosphate (Ap4A) HIT family hydrolase